MAAGTGRPMVAAAVSVRYRHSLSEMGKSLRQYMNLRHESARAARAVSLVLALVVLLAASTAGRAQERALLVTGFQAPPFLYLNEADEPSGLLVDLLQKASGDADVPVRFLVTSWPRAQHEARLGRADLIFPVVFTENRSTWLDYPEKPITRFEMMIFAREDAPFQFSGSAEDLHGLTIGKIERGRMHPNFKALEDSGQARIEGREDIGELLKGTALGRLDAFIAPHLMTLYVAQQLSIDSVKPFSTPMGVSDVYLAFAKNSPNRDLWNQLQRHLPNLDDARRGYLASLGL
ncbi:hypothetical protein GCM10011316_11960 [Roseibium aquae]|uniref:Solute-binding protein family 3/N-terminal domain-containing protein n=1 Tax=Roseibium aquae TaxID=1323746 RepID=A0A916TDV3_9HYPH|nr:transporter substrate-binding domain-containing protein [Roseibium aquae]GGB41615.1 hypothetical protein GCM10011316_11960 [Roseibium aquae]